MLKYGEEVKLSYGQISIRHMQPQLTRAEVNS